MKLLNIEIQNFKPFRNITIPQEGNLPNGLILIRGENSTGKSSLFEAILWALWGPDAVDPTNDELVSFTSSFCKVTLQFNVVGTKYKIVRSYDQAKGMEVVLFQKTKNAWRRVADKSRSVATKIDEVLNLELKQALHTLLVRQGEVALIANARPSDLRKLLIRVYNIELLNAMTGHLENLEEDVNSKKKILETDYRPEFLIQEQIADANRRVGENNKELEEAQRQMLEAEGLQKEIPNLDVLQEISDLTNEYQKQERELEVNTNNRDGELEGAGLASADEEVIEARLRLLENEKEKLTSEDRELEIALTDVDQNIGSLIGKSDELREHVSTLEKITDDETQIIECPTCSKPLTPEDRIRLLSEYKTELKEYNSNLLKLKKDREKTTKHRKEISTRLNAIASAIEAIRRVRAGQETVDESLKVLDAIREKLTSAEKESGIKDFDSVLKKYGVSRLDELQNKAVEFETTIKSLKQRIASINSSIKQEEKNIEKLERDALRSREIGAEKESLERIYDHARYVRLKLISGFLADYVVQKRLIGIVRGATNPYVRAFTNNQYSSVDLIATPASASSGSGLVIKIRDERDNATKKTSQLSFGDRTAISLALRLGISRTMSVIRPTKNSPAITPRVRCVLLDEPLGGLDKNRRQSIVRNLVNDTSFEQIFLITHTDIQEWDEVPTIDVSKAGSSSSAILQM
jgi:exonuclease SbcC